MELAASFAVARLEQERKRWRQEHPSGFTARPVKGENGEPNLFLWECFVPGRADTLWAGGHFPLYLEFPPTYPAQPPVARFRPPVPHLNIFPSGTVCLSILDEGDGWRPSMDLRQILVGVQDLLANPNPDSPAHEGHFRNFVSDRKLYDETVRRRVRLFAASQRPA
jgi:ubiquitin-conjugating enzyme E2 I